MANSTPKATPSAKWARKRSFKHWVFLDSRVGLGAAPIQ
jgi:hypothetical protein